MPPSEAERATAREWPRRARSNLARARQPKPAESLWEDSCFDAQQAAEKAVKAVLLWNDATFPYVHDIGALLETLERAGHAVPQDLWGADDLTRYAVETRYPGIGQPVTEDDYRKALVLAERVLTWAEQLLAAATTAE
jgi:HEPN domain-containing protein